MNDIMTSGGDAEQAEQVHPELQVPAEEAAEKKPDAAEDRKNKKIAKKLFTRMDASKVEMRQFLRRWQVNVEQRLGIVSTMDGTPGVDTGAGAGMGTDLQAELNPDWSLTKTKTANLYSQVPTVQGTHENNQYAAAVPPFMKSVNYEIGMKRANAGVAMKECLNDAVNASGIAGMMVGYAARFRDKQVPKGDYKLIPADQLQQLIAAGQIPMENVPEVTDSRFFMTRISPKDLLKPREFVGSNFDDAAWIGMRGRKPWAEAKPEWKLKDDEKASLVSGGQDPTEQLKVITDGLHEAAVDDSVEYEEVYYWRYRVDPEEPSFCAIWKLVRVVGRDEPVVHEPWRGQKLLEDGRYIGSKRFPIRILTLTYVSDNAIPPSDSEAGRPQVQDLRRSRWQMFQNRKHSVPMRWYNVNQLDPLTAELIRKGEWQGMIPVNSNGERVIGEVARASYPSEDLTFDRNTKADLSETWRLGANQTGAMSYGDHTKAETNVVQQNFATGIGEERGAVTAFFLGAVEVLAGWMCLYSDFPILTDKQRQEMEQAWDQKTILHDLVLKILPDSTIVLDVNQQLDRISKFANQWGKSGYVNVKPLAILAAELSGIDPTDIVVDPQPPKPEDPNISYRFTGKDDMTNPMVLGILQKRGELPTIQELQQVIELQKQMLQLAQAPLPAPNPAGPEGVPPPTLDGPPGPPKPMDPHAPDAHPEWTLMSSVAKRQRDIG